MGADLPVTQGEAAPIDQARDALAGQIEQCHPGWRVQHGLYGWTATREADGRTIRGESGPALEAMLSVVAE